MFYRLYFRATENIDKFNNTKKYTNSESLLNKQLAVDHILKIQAFYFKQKINNIESIFKILLFFTGFIFRYNFKNIFL